MAASPTKGRAAGLTDELAIQRIAAQFLMQHPALGRFTRYCDASALPSAERLHEIALLFERGGLGVVASETDAFQFHKFAMELGNAKSQGIMGEYYENGLCSPRQPQRARRFYARAAAAGDARAQYNLGRVLFHGLLGQKVQPARALDLWQKSAAQKFPAALHAIGFCHEKGHESFKINPMAAKRYYTMAAELLDSRAAFNLGLMYEKGNIFCEDETERFDFAAHWRNAASDATEPSLGTMRFETAENLGHVRASERLGALRNARRKSERLLQIHAQISGDAAPDAPGGGGSASDNEGPDRKNKDREAKNKDAPVSAHILGPDEP